MKDSIFTAMTIVVAVFAWLSILSFLSPKVHEDKLTGCQYIQTMFTMTPRFDSDGEMVCNEAQK